MESMTLDSSTKELKKEEEEDKIGFIRPHLNYGNMHVEHDIMMNM